MSYVKTALGNENQTVESITKILNDGYVESVNQKLGGNTELEKPWQSREV